MQKFTADKFTMKKITSLPLNLRKMGEDVGVVEAGAGAWLDDANATHFDDANASFKDQS